MPVKPVEDSRKFAVEVTPGTTAWDKPPEPPPPKPERKPPPFGKTTRPPARLFQRRLADLLGKP